MSHTTSNKTYYSVTETAQFVRDALKRAFVGVAFRVRSKSYSGGASITVSWVDGPTAPEVERVACAFSGASFDGSIDLKSYITSTFNGQPCHFGADYVFCNREYSEALSLRAYQRACSKYGVTPQSSWQTDSRRPTDWLHYDMRDYTHQIRHTMRPNGCVVTLKAQA